MNRIKIVGTGWSAGQLTLDAVSALTGGAKVILHTGRSACAGWLEEKGVAYETLDALYESCEDFDQFIEEAATRLSKAASRTRAVYAVLDALSDETVAALARRFGDKIEIAGGSGLALPCGASCRWER